MECIGVSSFGFTQTHSMKPQILPHLKLVVRNCSKNMKEKKNMYLSVENIQIHTPQIKWRGVVVL